MSAVKKNDAVILALSGYDTMSPCERQKTQTYMVELLKGFVIEIAKKFVGLAEFDDLCQAGYLAICTAIDTYDPTRTRPTTYFRSYIVGNMQKLCFGEQSQYYCTIQKKINDACNKFNAALDPNDPNFIQDFSLVPDQKLANITGLPISTIKEVKRQKMQTVASLTAVGEDIADEYNDTPENMLIKRERDREMAEALEELTPLEYFVIAKSYMGEKEFSVKAITRELNKDENKKRFNIRTIDAVFVEKKRESALKKMRMYYKRRNTSAPISDDYLTEVDDFRPDFGSKAEEETKLTLDDILGDNKLIDLF